MNNDVLVLEWRGKMAHFKDLSTNSTSLSYYAPPRTTVIGMLGLLLGLKENEYPHTFSTKISNIAVEPMSENINQIETFNYINNEKEDSDNVSVEYWRDKNFKLVKYWIYIQHKNSEILGKLEYLTKNSLSIGGTPGMGKKNLISYVDFVARTEVKGKSREGNVIIDTLTPVNCIEEFDFDRDWNEKRKITRTLMPRELKINRELKSVQDYIIPLNLKGIYAARVRKEYNIINVNGREKRVYWM